MHQAGVIIKFGWGPLFLLSVSVSLVGKGWVFDFPFLLIMFGIILSMNLQLGILCALHSLQSQQKISHSWTPVQVTGFHVSAHHNQWEFCCCA